MTELAISALTHTLSLTRKNSMTDPLLAFIWLAFIWLAFIRTNASHRGLAVSLSRIQCARIVSRAQYERQLNSRVDPFYRTATERRANPYEDREEDIAIVLVDFCMAK